MEQAYNWNWKSSSKQATDQKICFPYSVFKNLASQCMMDKSLEGRLIIKCAFGLFVYLQVDGPTCIMGVRLISSILQYNLIIWIKHRKKWFHFLKMNTTILRADVLVSFYRHSLSLGFIAVQKSACATFKDFKQQALCKSSNCNSHWKLKGFVWGKNLLSCSLGWVVSIWSLVDFES